MSRLKTNAFRGVRKGAHISRRAFSKASTLSGKVEQKAHRIINGTDPVIQIHDKVLFEKIEAEALPEIVPIHPALPLVGRKPAVTLLIPSLQKSSFFGGTATALIFTALLAQKKGLAVRVVETIKHGEAKPAALEAFFKSNAIDLSTDDIALVNLAGRKYNHYGYLDLHPEDVFVASAWWDAYLLDSLPLKNKFVYLIQDYEPIFYNNSDQFVLSESTYHKSTFVPVCNTRLMHEFMGHKGYKRIAEEGLYFEPAVNVGAKVGRAQPKAAGEKKRLFIYGRPSVHRNLFYSALSCVNQAFSPEGLAGQEWEVYMAGQDKLPDILLDAGVTVKNLGKLTMDEYYDFAKTVDVTVSLMMAPHPSYPPLELASLGSAVVTTTYETKQDLSQYSKNILVSEPDVDKLLANLLKAAAMLHDTRIKNAETTQLPTTWADSLGTTIDKVAKIV